MRTALNDQTLQYLRSLEQRLLEHELANRNENCENNANNNNLAATAITSKNSNGPSSTANGKCITDPPAGNFRALDVFSGRPEAVIRAMQILEVREQLDRDRNGGGGINANVGGGGGGASIGVGNNIVGNGIGASNSDDISMSPEHMAEGEKALLREMCNVVWRKLEDGSNNRDIV